VVSTPADDQALVEAARRGDRQAFRVLYVRYERRIFAVAFGFLRNQEDALDVVQEAFIKVHRYLPRFEGQSSFYTWLYRIVANLCIDHVRRARRGRAAEYDDRFRHEGADEGFAEPITGRVGGDPGGSVRDREIREAVRLGLDGLSDKHRAVIVMREFQGMSYAEMAEAMECSKGTIMSRLFHARKNMQRVLRERLANDVPEVGDDVDLSTGPARPSEALS
jgi:RNA polymerase sigma-70 factor (ECF subfamily)